MIRLFLVLTLALFVACSDSTPGDAPATASPTASLSDADIVDAGDLTGKPQIVEYGDVQYPEAAKADGVEGRAVLKILIDADGSVQDAEVVQSAGHAALDAAALAAAPTFRFTAGTVDGKAVKTTVMLPISFKLK